MRWVDYPVCDVCNTRHPMSDPYWHCPDPASQAPSGNAHRVREAEDGNLLARRMRRSDENDNSERTQLTAILSRG